MTMIVVLAVALGATLTVVSGASGVLYGILYLVSALPGLPLGWALFGRGHAAGWTSGLLIGYGLTQLALWVPIAASAPAPAIFVAAWTATAAAAVACGIALKGPLVPMPAWTRADTRGICLIALLALLIMAIPYRRIGERDAEGTRYYRAYFTADFFWHTALTAEIGRFSMPPRNPYLAPRPIHYYWAYFLLPAVTAQQGPSRVRNVQSDLKSNAICSAVLVLMTMWLLARMAVPRAAAASVAVLLGVTAASAEGAWVLQQLARRGRSLSAVKDLNIDAITAWQAQVSGLRIDCLPRSLWYNPQHSIACALGLVGALVASRGLSRSPAVALLAGLALALSTIFNPFIGVVFSAIYGAAMLWHAWSARDARAVFVHALAALPVGLAVLWSVANGVAGGAADAVRSGFGVIGPHPVLSLLLSTGPVLLPAVAGLWPASGCDRAAARVAIVGCAIALVLMHSIALSDAAWVGFRTGQILLLLLPVLLARVFVMFPARITAAIVAVILLAGLPTTVIDVYNAQDVGNRGEGPGFPWTVAITPAQQDAFAWLRRSTSQDAIVQMEPVVRGRRAWSHIPTFAERRMAAGLPISLLDAPEYHERSGRVQVMYATADAREAWRIAQTLRIEYVWVDPTDRAAYPSGAAKFDIAPQYFVPAYKNVEVSIYRVQ